MPPGIKCQAALQLAHYTHPFPYVRKRSERHVWRTSFHTGSKPLSPTSSGRPTLTTQGNIVGQSER